MKKAKIEKDGIWEYKWDGDAQEYKKKKPDFIWTLLRCECEIAEDVTLLDIFDAVEAEPELKAFISQYSWCHHIDEFHDDAHKENSKEETEVAYLEIHWHPETNSYKGKQSIDLSPSFHGIGKPDDDQTYSVSYSPMWKLAHLPVKLNTTVDLYEPFNRNKKEQKLIFHGERIFSLLEVLDAIYDDISFMGGPEDNVAFLEEMKDTMEEIKSGKAECVPWKEVFEEDDEEEDNPLFPNHPCPENN